MTVIVVLVTVGIALVVSFFAAVALAKYRFTGKKLFIVLVIGIQMLPTTGMVIPLYVVLARYHEVNKLSGLILVYLTFTLPFCIWMLRGFIVGIPKDLEEAAMVDGCSPFSAFLRIILPAVAPGASPLPAVAPGASPSPTVAPAVGPGLPHQTTS